MDQVRNSPSELTLSASAAGTSGEGGAPTLSIVIPTYRRNDCVVENIKRLLPQIRRSDVELIVLDNCSPMPVAESLEAAFGPGIFEHLQVVRNAGNLGLAGNSLRIFEMGRGDYIWPLCDDDAVLPNAVDEMLAAIRAGGDLVYLWFPVVGGPAHRKPGTYPGLLEAMEAEPNLFFIALSSNVFQRTYFLSRLRFGYLYSYSWAPFICPLLSDADNRSNRVAIHAGAIAQSGILGEGERWSKLDACIGIRTLLELPVSRRALSCLRSSIDSFTFSTPRLFIDSLALGDGQRWQLFRLFVERKYGAISLRAAWWLMLAAAGQTLPAMTRRVVRLMEHVLNRRLLLDVEDRFARS
ncbi:glycosyltransferase family 2 protein [Paludibaculum fermentans]|uniref:glycosyltransferase family 2 protein n=1 Tax=Paludibaculum fermentans TaxID=1473598 RepID=UPI003EC0695C